MSERANLSKTFNSASNKNQTVTQAIKEASELQTINTVSTLKAHAKQFYILDSNDNPCHIQDPNDFLSKLIARNQETLNTLSQLHDSLQRRK